MIPGAFAPALVIQRPPTADDMFLQFEAEQFLYHEAALLSHRRFREWFQLLADDLEYWMPTRSNRRIGEEEFEFARPGEGAYFDDTKELMSQRVEKLYTGYAWSEDPGSRVRYLVTNVRILESSAGGEIRVASNFAIYRGRLACDEDMWFGYRDDVLRRTPSGWQIARRHIYLDQVSLTAKNLSIFF